MSHPTIPGYTFDECRGGGAFGSVWLAQWDGGFECAVKLLTAGTWHPQYLSWCLERLRREGERPGLVRIFSYDLGSEPPYLTMTLLPGGTLSMEQLAGRLPAQEAWALLDSLAATLGWLHGQGIVHTGLSGGNVFVSPVAAGEPQVLLCDVGQGWLTGAPLTRLHGQIAFIPPEHWRASMTLLQEDRAQGRDVYAFGVIAWRLLTGQWPRGEKVFNAVAGSLSEDLKLDPESFAGWLEKQTASEWPAPVTDSDEVERRRVVEKCLALDPEERFSDMHAVQQALAAIALEKPVALPEPEPVAPAMTRKVALAEATQVEVMQACPVPEAVLHAAYEQPSAPPEARLQAPVFEAKEKEQGTEEAFPEEESQWRRFSQPLPLLSLSLQQSKAEARPWWHLLTGLAAAGFLLLSTLGVTAWAFKERSGRKSVHGERAAAAEKLGEMESRLPRLEADLSNARSESAAARAEQAAGARHRSVELISKLLASKPVEDSLLEGWRTALKAVAEHSSQPMENAPADAQGMEARWQMASLQHALGNADATLPLLESLGRDLEAAAIEAGAAFPPEQIRLSGRLEALTGSILHSQGRMEDALPHLRKAADALEKWTSNNSEDTATVRLFANTLLLKGLALEARAQYDQAKEVLIRVSGLINLPADDVNAMVEERFIDSDAKFALSRLRKMEAATAKPEEVEVVFKSAYQLQDEAQKLLLDYDRPNPKSVPCRARLARGYREMGLTLCRLHTITPSQRYAMDSAVAYGEGVKVYTDLLKELPGDLSLTLELASLYSDVAQLMHISRPGAGGITEAIDYQDAAVKYVQMLNETTPLDNTVRRHLAAAHVAMGEFQQDAAKTPQAMEHQNQALSLLKDLLSESSLSDKDRRLCRRASARAWTALASIYEKSGKRSDSISALTKAYADWEFSPVEDPSDQKKMAWVKETLDKLKPQ